MTYICDLCGNVFEKDWIKKDSLKFCYTCKSNRKEEIQSLITAKRKKVEEDKNLYWENHPEEKEKYLKERREKIEFSKIKKYGSLEQAEKIRQEKQLETLKKKYPNEDWNNITNVSQIKEVREAIKNKMAQNDRDFYKERLSKINNTKIQRHGSLEQANREMLSKLKETNLRRYGFESAMQNEEIKSKARQTTLEKYGAENYTQTEEYHVKVKQTSLEKYGTEHPSQNEEVKAKNKQTCLEKYGVESYLNTDEGKAKVREALLSKYGVERVDQIPGIREKIKKTCLEKYGVESTNQVKEIQERKEKTNLEKYGFKTPLLNEEIKNKIKDALIETYGVDNPSKSEYLKQKANDAIKNDIKKFEEKNNCTLTSTLVSIYGQGWLNGLDLPKLKYKRYTFLDNSYMGEIEEYTRLNGTNTSHSEKDVVNFIKSFYQGEVLENVRSIIAPQELDIYIPNKNLAIEFNGDFWHCSENVDRNYHEKKSRACEEKGIRLIHIYECEWKYYQEKIKSLLRLALGYGYSKIGARQCEVRKITNKEAEDFNNKNHLQGHRNAQVTYGLYYKDELQQLMSFSKTKYNRNLKKDNEWEIIRGCPGSNNQVIGGVSKLFKAFVKEYNPSAVFSYCDFNKFDGKSYEILGMKFMGYTGPDKFYVDKSGYKIMRNPKKRKELEESCNYIIYGAGSKKYMWRSNNA